MTKRWVISLVFAVLAVSNLIQNGASDDLLTWGQSGYGNGQFSSPTGLAADSSGNVYVADTGNNRIQKFDSDGAFLKRWGAMGQFSSPRGVAVDGSGNVYVADTGDNRIQKFDPDGAFLKKWGALGQFSSPRGVAVDDSGNVYVADTGNNRIQKFDSEGLFLKKWGTEGLSNGQFRSPVGVAADSSGNIYVADTGNNRIQKFDSEGVFLKKWGIEGYGNGQFSSPGGLAADSSGNVYVADTGNNRIQRFTSDGDFLARPGSPGQFNSPGGVAVDNAGSVYIADTGNHRIWKLTSDATDVAVSVDVDNAMPDEGNMVVYTVTVTNMGPNPATGVEVTDQLPPGVSYLSSDCSQGIYDQNAWYAGDLARHTSAWLTITAAVDPGTTGSIITNTATVTAAQADPINENNSDDAVIGVGGTDLTVSVEVDNAMPGEGDTITYELILANDGPNTATGLEVNCQLPPGMTYVSSEASQGSYSGDTGLWSVDILDSNTDASLTIEATVDPGTAGNIINNTARVTADQVDPMRSNDYDSAVIYVAVADVAVSVDVDDAMPGEGYTVTYTITATNNGPNTATGVEAVDLLPTGVKLVSSAPGQGSYSADTGVWDLGILAKNTSASLTIAAKTDPGTANTTITNTAVISADQSDPTPGNNSDSVTIYVAVADVAIIKNVDSATPGEGDTIIYTLTLVNNGPSTATNVEVIDQLPGGVEYVSWDSSQGIYSIDTGVWSVGSLSSNADAWLSINATVATGTSGTIITNAASVTADQADPVKPNNYDTAVIGVAGTDLAVSMDVDNAMPEEGDSITYTIAVSNNGPNIATGVRVTDHLPSGVTYVSSDATQGGYSNNTGLWDVGSLDIDTSASVTITVAIDPGTAGSVIINTASAASYQADPVSGNNSHSASIKVQRVDVRVLMSVSDAKPREGDRIVYTIEVKNNGPNDAVELVITDQLPSGVTHVTSMPSQGNYDNGTGVWDVGSLASGAYAAMTIIVSADPGSAGVTIINTASITAVRPVDRDNDNDSASSSITVNYTITATTGPNGGMEPSGAVGVVPGASQEFTMTPAKYYRVADVEVDGESVGAVTEYTFENVTSNHTIHATFELIPLELLTVTYDILIPTLIFTFSTWVDPGLTSFDMIGMEVDDSGEWDFAMSDARGLVPRTFPAEANKVIVDIKRDYVNSMNLALALEKHKKVDILMESGAFTAMSGVKSNPVTGTDNIRVHIMADGVDFGIFGDVSGDGEVTTSDAELILQAVVNESPTVFPVYNTALAVNNALDAQGCKQDVSVSVADMDNSGDISGFDASLVLQFVAGRISNLSKAVRGFLDLNVSGGSRTGGLRVNNSKDQKLDLIVVLSDFRKVYSIDMVIEYNTEMLALDYIRRQSSTSDWLLEYRSVSPGKLRLSLAGPSQLATDDAPLTIGFHAFCENAANYLDVTEFRVNGVMGIGIVECPGSTSNLLQNYPNPFNPATWIPYQLSEDANVTIRICDISGRIVRTLNLGHRPAGFYTATSKAAYWDGRNEAGEHVASGVYFYTVQAGDFTATRKMLILR